MKMVLLYKLRSSNPSTKQFKGYIFMLCVYIKPPQIKGFTESIWLFTYSQRLINTFLSTFISFQSNNRNDNRSTSDPYVWKTTRVSIFARICLFVCFITDLRGIMEMEIKPAYIHNQRKPHVVAFKPVSGSEGHSQSVWKVSELMSRIPAGM